MPEDRSALVALLPHRAPFLFVDDVDACEPADPASSVRRELAYDHLEDLRHLDGQMRASKRRLERAVRASGTTVTVDTVSQEGRNQVATELNQLIDSIKSDGNAQYAGRIEPRDGVAERHARDGAGRLGRLQRRRQVMTVHDLPVAHQHRTLERVLELAHVTRPAVLD